MIRVLLLLFCFCIVLQRNRTSAVQENAKKFTKMACIIVTDKKLEGLYNVPDTVVSIRRTVEKILRGVSIRAHR